MPNLTQNDYQYSPSKCDVHDQPALIRFCEKRGEWVNWLTKDDRHAIESTLCEMLWSNALFRLVNKCGLQVQGDDASYAIRNSALHRLITSGYVHEQLTTIRCLTEQEAKIDNRQVISLRRLIDDVRRNRHLLTREIFVAYDGLPYDFETVPEADRMAWAQEGGGFGSGATTDPIACQLAYIQHRSFDKLSGIDLAARTRFDRVSDNSFERIEKILNDAPFQAVTTYLNKIIAHAATPSSRGKKPLAGVKLDEITKCHEALVRATVLISRMINADAIASVATPLYDVMEHWTSPFCPADKIDALRAMWDTHATAVEEWRHID